MPPSRNKAKEMLRHGSVHGKPLTKKQRGLFGAIAGGQMTKYRSPDRYTDDSTNPVPPRIEYHAEQDGLPQTPGGGKPAGGTDSPRVTVTTKQAGNLSTPSGGKKKWPEGVDSYTDGTV